MLWNEEGGRAKNFQAHAFSLLPYRGRAKLPSLWKWSNTGHFFNEAIATRLECDKMRMVEARPAGMHLPLTSHTPGRGHVFTILATPSSKPVG